MLGMDIAIDKTKCNGCGLCVKACHEGALAMVDGKAELVRKDFCDGLGDCLPACPMNAISFVPKSDAEPVPMARPIACNATGTSGYQWPIQMALVPPVSEYYRGTIVIAADCTAFTLDDFRKRVMNGRPVIIGCPKLDDRARFDKIAAILKDNPVDEVLIVRMEVPCCRGLSNIVRSVAATCGRSIEVREMVVSRSGSVL